jgi:hypothetical protein
VRSEALAFEISPEVGLRYGSLTPDEFGQIVDGYQRRNDRAWERTAWLVSHLLGAWVEKPPTPDTLLGATFVARRAARDRAGDPVAP